MEPKPGYCLALSVTHSLTHAVNAIVETWPMWPIYACEIIHLSASTPRYLNSVNTVLLLAMFKLDKNITHVVYFLWMDDVLVNWPVQWGASQLLGIPGVIQQASRFQFIIRQKKGQRCPWCNWTKRRMSVYNQAKRGQRYLWCNWTRRRSNSPGTWDQHHNELQWKSAFYLCINKF